MSNRFECDTCNKCFTRKASLDYHIKQKACREKEVKCKFCDALFVTKISMYRHMRTACKTKQEEDRKKDEIYERLIKLEEENKLIKKQMEQTGLDNDNKIKQIKIENNNKIKKLMKDNKDLKKQRQSTYQRVSITAQ